ncbi:hypothetical protein L1049_006567 [Liquidambar formosana]|uniref:Heme-binding protein 2 n=1 Tax=Liquidambar formosana TaxID=63359 RepID=A0AAP0WUB2_LIQFO
MRKMERVWSLVIILSFDLVVICCDATETPQYTVVHSEPDFDIRLYAESYWMSALVRGISFEKSTEEGFHRLYQYIHGANLNSSRLMMTAPVLTSITPTGHGFEYLVRFFLPAKYEGIPPQPNPELNLLFYEWRSHCIAVRKFSGFAKDDTINEEKEALVASLDNRLTGKTAVLEDKEFLHNCPIQCFTPPYRSPE